MGDDDHGAVVVGQERLQPGQRGEVEVVRRLVEQQERGRQQQQPGERRAHPPAARELGERPRELGPGGSRGRPGWPWPPSRGGSRRAPRSGAADRRSARSAPRSAPVAQQPRATSSISRSIAHTVVEAAERLGEDRAHRLAGRLLRQIADGRRRAARLTRPVVRLLDAGQDAAERRLAGAVGADQADALALGDAPRQVAEERLAAVALRRSPSSWITGAGAATHPMLWTRSGSDLHGHPHLAGLAVRVRVLPEVLLGQRVDVGVGALSRSSR